MLVGAPACGMNAAVRAFVRVSISKGVRRGMVEMVVLATFCLWFEYLYK